MTYNQIIERNQEFSDAHRDLKNFGVGGDFDMVLGDQENPYRYNLMWMEDLPSPIEAGLESFNFRVYFLGQVTELEHREGDLISTNRNEVISNMRSVAIDFLSYWKQLRSDNNVRFSILTTINVSEDITPDKLYGVNIDVSFKVLQAFNKCIIPMSGIPTPESQDVSIYGNDTLMVTVACGNNYEFEIRNESGDLVGTWNAITKIWTVPDGGGSTSIDIAVNSTPFYSGVSTNQDLPVKKSDGTTNTGSKVGANWQIANSQITVNTVNAKSVLAESTADIPVVASDGSTGVGNWNISSQKQVVSDSTVNVKDSAGTTLYAVSVLAEDTADQTVSDGSIILQNEFGDTITTYTNKAQEARVVQLHIIYMHPANSGHGTTSFLTGDEGWNEVNRPRPAVPLIGIPALLDPANPRKLLYKNIYGHLHRFVGINGGYYDYDTATYHLADGTVSDVDTVFGTIAANTSYMWDTHTQIGRKWNVQGSTNWSAHVAKIHALTHAGFSDYFLGSRKQHESWLAGYDLSVAITSIKPIDSNNSCKTSTPTFGFETTQHHQINGTATSSTRSDATSDSTFAFRWHSL